ncbi:hypothetical protein [Thomasclavelia cocleata]|uniref:hypothetical protein n=1 Tax=Thomasclavelia cocleata TaxID=69824 RepID=UPI00272E7D63|nr:hypothetical protein [Thomasclavelia cocleata]
MLKIFKQKKDVLIFIIGLALVCYPIVSNFIENNSYHDLIKTYENRVDNLSDEKKQQIIDSANDWNRNLYLKQQGMSIKSQNYNNILNINDGVMGSIEIPKINVNIAIYHGTDDNILNINDLLILHEYFHCQQANLYLLNALLRHLIYHHQYQK